MLKLCWSTPPEWAPIALADFDAFLRDHAANERKVSTSALALVTQNPDRAELVESLIEVAREELDHFQQVYRLLRDRGCSLAYDQPDPYTGRLHQAVRNPDVHAYLLDRLLLFGIIEARGCERFALIAQALAPGALKTFYEELVRSESRHHALYLRLAKHYFDAARVACRLEELLRLESEVISSLPLRSALH
jgi:tRNA-(ms[2]io[6]A)-hydroxylase